MRIFKMLPCSEITIVVVLRDTPNEIVDKYSWKKLQKSVGTLCI